MHVPCMKTPRVSALTLAYALDADVVYVEYPGFGLTSTASGVVMKAMCCACCCGCACNGLKNTQVSYSATEQMCRDALEATYEFVRKPVGQGGLGTPRHRVVLYGASLGTAFTADFASTLQVAAVVFVGAMTSALRVMCSNIMSPNCPLTLRRGTLARSSWSG